MSGAPPNRPAEDALVRDACGRSRAERIRDLARELGRSETAIRRRWQWLRRGIGRGPVPISPAIDQWNTIMDANAAGCGLRLSPEDVSRLAGDDAIQRAALDLAIRPEWTEREGEA